MSKHFAFFEYIIMISSTNINHYNFCDKISVSAWRDDRGNPIKDNRLKSWVLKGDALWRKKDIVATTPNRRARRFPTMAAECCCQLSDSLVHPRSILNRQHQLHLIRGKHLMAPLRAYMSIEKALSGGNATEYTYRPFLR